MHVTSVLEDHNNRTSFDKTHTFILSAIELGIVFKNTKRSTITDVLVILSNFFQGDKCFLYT